MIPRRVRCSLPALFFLLAALPCGLAAQALPLGVDQPRSGSVAPGDTARFTFEAGDDFLLYGEVNQVDVDVVVTLTDAEGSRVGPAWNATARGPEAFSTRLRTAGTYTLAVAPVADGAGRVEVTILQLEARSDDPRRLADQLMFAYARPGGPGGAVQVWRGGETVFSRAYGLANLEHAIPFRTTTPTNIGSTSKQFTGFAVLRAAERGHLDLDDDIREYLPELPDFGQVITIRHLLTHTSGLREFLNLYTLTGAATTGLQREQVLTIARRQPALQNAPGTEFNYNNTAFVLAATIVERTSGQAFDAFVHDHIFEPLGMTSSRVRMEPRVVIPGRSDGYSPGASGWTAPGDLGGAVGAGGIYTSVEDLQRWGQNLLDPKVGSPASVEALLTEHLLVDGQGTGYGLGLFLDEQRGLQRRHHGGSDVSHRSMFVLYPDIDAGLTVQSNASTFNSRDVAFQLGAAFFGDAMGPEEPAVADAEAAPRWAPGDLSAYVGRFFSDEIEVYFDIRLETPGGDDAAPRLVMHQLWRGDRPLTAATDEDTFTAGGGLTLQFERDRAGRVTEFYVDAGRTRDVRFVRVDAGGR